MDLVSSMNPFFWADGSSLNSAAEDDWIDVAKSITDDESVNSQQAFQIMYEYVNFHKREFGFEYYWLLDELIEKTHQSPKWRECVDRAME